jgi:hypothetical protein
MQVVLAAVSDAFRLRQRPPRPEDPLDRETPSTPSPEEEAALAAAKKMSNLDTLYRESLEAQDWTEPLPPAGKYILFHLLTAITWPETSASHWVENCPEGLKDCALLTGRAFDSTALPPSRLRPLSKTWASWSGKHCLAIARAWSGHSVPDARALVKRAALNATLEEKQQRAQAKPRARAKTKTRAKA